MTKVRKEKDSLGDVVIPSNKYWGAQTQRSLEHFPIGLDRYKFCRNFIKALGIVKKSAIDANIDLGLIKEDYRTTLLQACNEVISGELDSHFPLVVFQTGSGTHTNMNANEVIANRANEILGQDLGSKYPIHPNDHINLGQSSNDVIPTAMHLAAIEELNDLLSTAAAVKGTLSDLSQQYNGVIKVGRTHLQDAVPISLGQEISSWHAQIQFAIQTLLKQKKDLYPVAIGGTAVGTGINTHPKFAQLAVEKLSAHIGEPISVSENKFSQIGSHDALLQVSSGLRLLATSLTKMGNDIRWLASGPNGGIGELLLPQNEPGSSIMPGKVNPSQCEALTMVCAQIIGNDAVIAFANSQSHFQLNTYKPVIIHNLLESASLLKDAMKSFTEHCLKGIKPNHMVIKQHLDKNLMLVTALAPLIGYDKCAKIASIASESQITLLEACLKSGWVTEEEFRKWVKPESMIYPNRQ